VSVTGPAGFTAAGVAAGLKDTGALDLALVALEPPRPVPAAATFTTNRAAAAPVQVSRANLVATGGHAGAVVLNSGCANAATGEAGRKASEATCAALGAALGLSPREVIVCSTGLIGVPLALDRLLEAVPGLVATRQASPAGARAAAEAIMTTDTHPKQTLVEAGRFRVGGMAKGAGMLAPNMATMLAVLTTDAAVSSQVLSSALRRAVRDSFNELTVDGCTSTNDTVTVLASGEAGAVEEDALAEALTEACRSLAFQLAQDAEGTTRVARIVVSGAASGEDARRAARRVAESLLVKTSLHGADPYWGRVVSELGASGAAFELDRVAVSYGGIRACQGGVEAAHDRVAAREHLSGKVVEIHCDLGLGEGMAEVLTTDLGHGYIDENMRTS
jgi:glutamate N-acetyltransferase/amino-acid N-acetyltransferase